MQIPHIRDYAGKHIHMIGIGGSSMSGLAEMLLDRGYNVSGSDRADGYLLRGLREKGIDVKVGHSAQNVAGADLVAYTAAIPEDNPERAACKALGIPTLERAYLLGQLMEGCPQAIAVSGTHGKTTVTSMLSQILLDSGLDPSIHIGGVLDAIGGSVRTGHSGIFVTEACEFKRSFLQLRPTITVILNIDADHLDCYRDIDEIEETFGTFLDLLPADGLAIGNGSDVRVLRRLRESGRRYETYALTGAADWTAADLAEDPLGCFAFTPVYRGERLPRVTLAVPGRFNAENALAALAAAHAAGAAMDKAAATLSAFVGAHRRFELTDTVDGVELFTDYGHNPAEMGNAIRNGRKRADSRGGRLWAVMQPHTFSRVKRLFADYLTCTAPADFTLVTDIFAAREQDPGDIDSGMLVAGMREKGLCAEWTPGFAETEAYLRAHWQPGDVVLTMGCGDINRLNDLISQHHQKKASE